MKPSDDAIAAVLTDLALRRGRGKTFCPSDAAKVLAAEWRPYIETCIEAFGADRGMFESNFPVDMGSCDYATLWNAFKRLAAGASADEKAALFAGTARRVYRLDI